MEPFVGLNSLARPPNKGVSTLPADTAVRAQPATSNVLFVHPLALCESNQIGEGTRIWAFSHVMNRAIVGRHCNIGEHVYVESGASIGDRVTVKNNVLIWDGVTIEDDVFLGPGVIFTNDRHPRSARMSEAGRRYARRENWLLSTLVQRGASIGAGAILLPGITIGRGAAVGAGAVVTREVPAHRLVVGNPARPAGWVCLCGLTLPAELSCRGCRRLYRMNADELELIDESSKEE